MKYALYVCLSLCAAGSHLVTAVCSWPKRMRIARHTRWLRRFIDGPARDSREVRRRSRAYADQRVRFRSRAKRSSSRYLNFDQQQTTAIEQRRRNELDVLSAKLKQARANTKARPGTGGVQVLPPPKRNEMPTESRTVEIPNASETLAPIAPQQRSEPLREFRNAGKARTLPPPGYTVPDDDDVRPRTVSSRVTVLLVLRPSGRSSRRFHRTADPVICVSDRCFVSAGAGQDARTMSRRRTLGPGNSLGRRAGSCRRSPTCVFRNVDLGQRKAWLQPIDLGWLRHDRRRPVEVASDPTCKVAGKRLSCDWTIETRDYRLWVVPEAVAQRVGADVLRKALASGLRPHDQHADARDALVPASRTH